MAASTELSEACANAARAYGLGDDDVLLVESLTQRPRRSWPACCGAGCETCMEDVICAAERALRETGQSPPA